VYRLEEEPFSIRQAPEDRKTEIKHSRNGWISYAPPPVAFDNPCIRQGQSYYSGQ